MTDLPADPVPDPPELDPGTLGSAEFGRTRKGFEPVEVRALLGRAADALRAWKERDDRLTARLADLERRLEQSQELDEQRITTVLGEETARIVAAAREAATEIRTKAETQAAQLVADSEERAARLIADSEEEATATAARLTDEATALRDEAAAVRADAQEHADRVRAEASAEHDALLAKAKTVLDERTAEAEAVASGIREAAQIELDAARAEGVRLRDEARVAADAEVERSRAEGRAMVDEARQLRKQMLQDLAERRRTARRQMEAARAGRDRIVESLGAAADRVVQVIEDLAAGDDQIQRAADAAAAAVDDDIDEVVAELETGLGPGALLSGSDTVDDVDAGDDGLDAQDAEPADDAGDQSDPQEDAVASPELEVVGSDGPPTGADVEPSPGATVHDLFERIRAERRADSEAVHPSVDPSDGSVDVDLDLYDDEEDDEGDESGDDDGSRGAEGSDDELAPVVVLEPADLDDGDGGDAGDAGDAGGADVVAIETTAVDAVIETTVRESTVVAVVADSADDGVTVVEVDSVETTTVETEVVPVDAVVDLDAAAELDVALEEAAAESSALDRRDDLLGGVEKAMTRSLKRLVSDEQNEVLDRLRRIRRGRVELEVLLPVGDDLGVFAAALHDDFAAAADAGARFWAAESGDDVDSAVARIDADVVEGGLEVRVADLLELRRAHLARALENAESDGVELAEMADHVRAAYREWRTRSVPDLAGDLATAGFALGEQAAAGDGTSWCWMVDNGGLPCSDAEDNALAGPTPCGSAFPTGDIVPPAHPGCRCILVPAPR